MTIYDLGNFAIGGGVVAALLIIARLVSIKPIELHPFQSLGKAIGRSINAEVLSSITEIKTEIAEMKDHQARIEKKSDRQDADIHRSRILRFADDIKRGVPFSEEYYIQIIEDVNHYEQYCESDKEYKNSRAISSIAVIRAEFEKHCKDKSFL